MPEVSLILVVSAFVAGVLMFLAPCTLPLLPAYLAFISGVKTDEVLNSREVRRKIFKNALAFVVGFTIVFVIFGILAGLFGSFIGQFRNILAQVGGVFIILFGLMMLNVVSLTPLLKERRLTLPVVFTPGEPLSALVIGFTFALGWTPCVGPVLASVLLLASTTTTLVSGALLLLIFSLGLAIPFLLVALLYARATMVVSRVAKVTRCISKVGGVFLIIIGVLLLTSSFGLTVEYGYKLFDWFGLNGLFDYL